MGKIAFAMSLSLSLFVGKAGAQEITCDAGVIGTGTGAVHHRLASEGGTSRQRRATSSGVLARALAGSERIEDVQRPLVGNCIGVVADNAGSARKEVIDPAKYKPKTKHDNTPWRFDMQQNGKRMTADEFDAWMKARGVRVAKGAPVVMAEEKPARRTRRRD